MPRTDYGTVSSGLTLQPGWSLRVRDDGTLAGRCVFACDSDDIISLMPRRGTEHPKNRLLTAYEVEGTAKENGRGEIVVDYIGLARDPSDVRFQFIGEMMNRPIETHPNFSSTIAGTPDAPLVHGCFDGDGFFVGFPNNTEARAAKLAGVESYLHPGLVYRATFFTAKPSLFKLASAGRRTLAPIGFPAGVTLPSGCEWLTMAPVMEQYGIVYKISQDYKLSGPEGVNQLIYSTDE